MTNQSAVEQKDDRYNLKRFLDAQRSNYDRALAEIKSGRKRSHWMWYIFPQYDGLGTSPMSSQYAIKSLAEAEAYLAHPVLGDRLTTCAEAVLQIDHRSAYEIFGTPDDMKLRSCATLFAQIAPPGSVFERVLAQFYQGEPDPKTLALLSAKPPSR